MNSQDLQNLQEAYLDVYEERDPSHPHWETNRQFKKSQNKNKELISASQKRKEDRERNRNPLFGPSGKMTKSQKEQVDLYDIILSHLLDEGYADTQEAAEVIMVNMSEDWRESIMIDEGFRRFPKKRVGEKIDRMYDDPNIDIVFGNDARRRHMMKTVYTDMEGKVHPLIRAYSPKKSKAASAANRNRPESERRSKTV